ncbi:hypothetical protein TNCV_1359361 [Trichonephila clavipes]|nr:hypothetical protein TNCV_1359361 [Trichonephila clavipes]
MEISGALVESPTQQFLQYSKGKTGEYFHRATNGICCDSALGVSVSNGTALLLLLKILERPDIIARSRLIIHPHNAKRCRRIWKPFCSVGDGVSN